MAKTAELREMSDEQVHLTWKDAAEHLFRLRIQAQTEKLDAPSELRRQRRLIARCQTILNERRAAAMAAPPVKTAPVKATPVKTSSVKRTAVKTAAVKASTVKTAAAKK